MKKPSPKRALGRSARRVRQALLMSTGLLAAPSLASAQAPGCTTSGGVCTIAAGSYSQPFFQQPFSGVALNLVNNGTFNVVTAPGASFLGAIGSISNGQLGANSNNSDAGAAGSGGNVTVQINQNVTHSLQGQMFSSVSANAIYAASIGGNGGAYTNNDAKHNAGSAGGAGTASLTNAATITVGTITVSGSVGTLVSGAALLVDSVGGSGGDVTSRGPDQNGNPTYSTQNGTPGESGNTATLINSGVVNVALTQPLIGYGYWGVAARSLGGIGGTGNNGQAGGGSLDASVTNTGNVNVAFTWGVPGGFTANTPMPTPGGFAVHARSEGGAGNMSVNSGSNGGSGGSTGMSSVTLGGTGQPVNVTLTTKAVGVTNIPLSAAVGAVSLGGAGGAGYDSSIGGTGGATSTASVTVLDGVTIQANGPQALGVLALAQGGAGNSSGIGQNNSRAGNAGSTGYPTDSTNAAAITITNASVGTSGSNAAGLAVISRGGTGGLGLEYIQKIQANAYGGVGGAGGNSGPVRIDATGATISTTGQQSSGILALALGGAGGDGGGVTAGDAFGGNGGTGGQAAPIIVNINAGTSITTTGGPAGSTTTLSATPVTAAAYGVFASSGGGIGGVGGSTDALVGGVPGTGGLGAPGYDVTVTLASGSSVTTSGDRAIAVVARSVGGAGGSGSTNNNNNIITTPANGGKGGGSGTVTITNAAQIITGGASAHGLVALSITGTGGDGASATGIVLAPAGSGASSGATGLATVTNTGSIMTSGASAVGIQVQSIGGPSGSGGTASRSLGGLGGGGGDGVDGGAAAVTHSGSITTQGTGALGILAQSIGGGGGNGGDAAGVIESLGGSGSGGGAGGNVTVNVSGSVTTSGQLAHGVVAQSIGGGGGNGGNSTATNAFISLSIGGSADSGGAGGSVTFDNSTTPGGSITLAGSNAIGLLVQSVGGGGGTGGGAYATSAGVDFSAAVALGGTGGGGGVGGTTIVTLQGLTIRTGTATVSGVNTNPVDAYGVVVQSIAGGGGVGGSASASALAIGIPDPEDGASYSAALTYAMGGSGGTGANGGAVTLTMERGTSITTQGQGSHAIVLQSIGGGGGAGGDSSSLATTINYGASSSEDFSLQASVAVGGKGQSGGSGGAVTGLINAGMITTYGDFANGMLAQSIGGGGGNGGVGSSNTKSFGDTSSVNVTIGVGGTGGSGGAGGSVVVRMEPPALIQTFGAGAMGILAQSIGGGGGASQGTTVNLGTSLSDGDTTLNARIGVSVGATGGQGGNANSVTGTIRGRIRTAGGDASGIVLQSIGGGGGVGGTAGADASADNPVNPLTQLRDAINDEDSSSGNKNYAATVAVGGSGGVAGNAGSASLVHSGSITTQGDWSHGAVVQSIGGGGGMGGVATSTASGSSFSAAMALGGAGGAGGQAGGVSLIFEGPASISTGLTSGTTRTGFAAFGVLAQSIGGGGGTAADGSASSTGDISVGGGTSASGGAAGNGNTVLVNGAVSIVTRGDAAMGMVLQSIGGGGGVAGSGASISVTLPNVQLSPSLNVGGQNGSSGNGGSVTINNASLTIQTAGANAYGLLAQSIGGGGGLAFTGTQAASQTTSLGAVSNGMVGNGGVLGLTLTGGSIQTAGAGAHGIVAQSIGGGGGIAGLPAGSSANVVLGYGQARYAPLGSGGAITITSSTPITTQGSLAYGILAQSIGGGGGLVVTGGNVFAGFTSNASPSAGPTAAGGAVTITQSAPISATGNNSIGIFAQSVGPSGDGVVSIDVQSSIQGGSGANGWGVFVKSGNTNNSVLVEAGASVSAASGNAIYMQAGGARNQGTVTGNVQLENGTFNNEGTHNAATTVVANEYVNTGLIAVASHVPFGVTNVSGNFTQGASGRLALDADFAGGRSDVMVVQGAANLAGRVRPMISSVLPDVELPFLVVNGPVTGSLQGEQTAIFGYQITRKGGTHSVSANADFTPAGYNLARDSAATAGHLQSAWDAGGSGLGRLFAQLGNLADAGGEAAYTGALRQISPNGGLAPGARVAAGARAFANAAMSCPQFDGTTAMLKEGECAWAGLTGRTAGQSGQDGVSSFRLSSTTWQAGGQRSMGGGWFLGGSVAYENARLTTPDGLNGGRGQAGYGAITAKYQTGPWLFAGAVFGGGGAFNGTRTITLPGFGSIARGSPTLSNVGAMLRGTYTIGGEALYLRPSLSLSLIHSRSSAYTETGAGVLNLSVSDTSSTVAALTPALEIGGRATLANGTVLRLFTSAGVSLLSQGQWSQRSRLTVAPAAAADFSTVVRTDQVVGRITAGVQVFATDRLELRLQYDGEYSSNLTGHGGSFALAYRF
jgi:hypothetical protein